MELKVSVIQFQPSFADVNANIGKLKILFSEIPGSKLVVLPELAGSGYNFKNRNEAFEHSEEIGKSGLFQDFLLSQAKSKGQFIVSGIIERDDSKLYNTAILAGPEGLMGKYRKMHLFMNEKDIFTPGDAGLPVFDIGGVKTGIMICFDYLFPEPWRIMAQKGADLICHPSNLLTENPHKCLPGLALINRIYIATANRIGTEGNITFNGRSMFVDPSGSITGMASPDKEEIMTMIIDTDRSRNKMVTPRNHAFNDRRPEAYQP